MNVVTSGVQGSGHSEYDEDGFPRRTLITPSTRPDLKGRKPDRPQPTSRMLRRPLKEPPMRKVKGS